MMRMQSILVALLVTGGTYGINPLFSDKSETVFGRAIDRGGFHFQFALGAGAGTRASGTFSNVELGYTFRQSDLTVMFWHPMIENDSHQSPTIASRYQPVVIGFKRTCFYADLTCKVGVGGSGSHEPDFSNASIGFGAAWGWDLHFPAFTGHGFTLGFTVHHVILPNRSHHAISLGAGYEIF
ncbi:MAG: hypothetical protein U1F16_02610 [Turneriella sp.]